MTLPFSAVTMAPGLLGAAMMIASSSSGLSVHMFRMPTSRPSFSSRSTARMASVSM